MVKKVLFALFCLLMALPDSVQATHLVGGSMSYEYLGQQSNGRFRYRITLKMYRDCRASVVQFDPFIEIGIYNNNSLRDRAQAPVRVNMISETQVNPPSGGSDCSFAPDVCIRQGIYQGLVDVNASTLGYHVVFQRCCRNTQENLLDDMGQTYYAFIPPTSIRNNSPSFTEVPAPYICRNDLVSLNNGAIDIDGDSLVYSLATPWSGGTDTDPEPDLPLSWPAIPAFPEVQYKFGHSVIQPFGNGGTANINQNNGVTQVLAPRNGRHSIAIDVREYRNGVLLSMIRLDIQLIVITCPPNDVPVITTDAGTFNFTVVEGQQLCFDIITTDPDNDNVRLNASGQVFTGGPTFGNTATFTTTTGATTARSRFCWTPSCGRAEDSPYTFSVESQDDGCPPKRRLESITITVLPFNGTSTLNGPDIICSGQKNVTYTTAGSPGSTFEWDVTGGNLISGQGTTSVEVDWGTGTGGVVRLVEVNAGGCRGDEIEKQVQILAAPTRPTINGKDTICEFSTENYNVTPVPGYTYRWAVQGGNINSGIGTNSIQVNWGAEGNALVSVVQINSLGCGSDTAYRPVNLQRAVVDSLYGPASVCPYIRGVEYRIFTPNSGSTYIWTVSGGTQVSGGNTSLITVNWGNVGNGFVQVQELSRFGCLSDPVRLPVLINHALVGMAPVGEDTLCENATNILYEVINSKGSKYFWSIQGGTILNDDSSSSVRVNWNSAGTGRITVYEISYDSINNLPCIGSPQTLNVLLAPYPTQLPIIGPDEICQSNVQEFYHINGFDQSRYFWTYTGSGLDGQGNDTVSILPLQPGNYQFSVRETSRFGCAGPLNVKNIIIHPRPVTTGIFGDEIICFPNYNNRAYSVNGFATSIFTWTVNGGTITSGTGTNSITIDFNGQANNRVDVFETSDFGCLGDTLTLDVFADNPSIDMKVVSLLENDETRMEIKWELLNAPRYNAEFHIQRRTVNQGSGWNPVGNTDLNTFSFINTGVDPDRQIYEYRVLGQNLCKDSLYSEVHRHVQISGRKQEDPYTVEVNWTRYLGWTDGVNRYELYRKDGDAPYVLINDAGNDTNDFYEDGTKSYRQCYKVKSYELNGQEVSWSNEICFDFPPILIVPNAFTPNGDRLNEGFHWSYASIRTFEISIYNRWGEELYTSQDVAQPWDGTYKGAEVPEGVYAFIIRYTGADRQLKIVKGNITLLR